MPHADLGLEPLSAVDLIMNRRAVHAEGISRIQIQVIPTDGDHGARGGMSLVEAYFSLACTQQINGQVTVHKVLVQIPRALVLIEVEDLA